MDVEKPKPMFIADGKVTTLEKSGNYLKNLNINLPLNPAIPLLRIYPKKLKTYPPKGVFTNLHSSAISSLKLVTNACQLVNR